MRKLLGSLAVAAALFVGMSMPTLAHSVDAPLLEKTFQVTYNGTTYACTVRYYDRDHSGTPTPGDRPVSVNCARVG